MRESELLQHVYRTAEGPTRQVPIPPGDDMAMVLVGDRQLLAAVDQVVAGRHFDLATPLEAVGRKAVTRSLSDVAAMAGRPLALLATVTLPRDFGQDRATALFDAMHAAARQYECPLVGGDIAIHADTGAPLVCTVTVLAEPGPAGAVGRSGALAGDRLYVTGRLGGSLEPGGQGRHLSFEPRIGEALRLAEQLGGRLHAMIDISDGLGCDAGHLAECSGVAIEIDARLIPCTDGLDWRRAMGDGEDYELCFAAEGDAPARLDGLPVTEIGRVIDAEQRRAGSVVVRDGTETFDAAGLGWEHRS